VAVVSYGLVDGLTFPLMFEIYKPKERLQLKDSYLSKPQIASQTIREIKAMGCEIDCVLADSLYGESRTIPLLSLSAENNAGCLKHKTFIKNLDFRHSVRK
jgi:SRSO17 transposase